MKLRPALEELLVSDEWLDWIVDKGSEKIFDAEELKKDVMSSLWWENVTGVLELCKPIYLLVRLFDGDTPTTGKVFGRMAILLSNVREQDFTGEIVAQVRQQVVAAVEHRWNMLTNDMQRAGYLLDPEYRTCPTNDEAMVGFMNMVVKLVPDEDHRKVLEELEKYREPAMTFTHELAMQRAKNCPSHTWWQQYGGALPHLQKMAVRILAQVTSACSCERNWSTFEFIHSESRNRLGFEKATGLVYVFSNLRLRDRLLDDRYATCVCFRMWALFFLGMHGIECSFFGVV